MDFQDPFAEVRLTPLEPCATGHPGTPIRFRVPPEGPSTRTLPGYIGMIGSRRRVRATFEALLEEGFSREVLGQVRAPIGLDIGGETPAEIAISVAAEMVLIWRGGPGAHSGRREDPGAIHIQRMKSEGEENPGMGG